MMYFGVGKILSKEDAKSLDILASLSQDNGKYLDIGTNGHIRSQYSEGWGACLYRTTWGYMWYGNSTNIPNLKFIFDRIYQAYRHGDDETHRIPLAIEGLKALDRFYEGKNQQAQERIIKVIEHAEAVFSLVQKEKRSEQPEIKHVGPKEFGCLHNLEQSVISCNDGFSDCSAGLRYYEDKIKAFLDLKRSDLSIEARLFFQKLGEQLRFAFKVLNFLNPYSPENRNRLVGEISLLPQRITQEILQHFDQMSLDDREKIGIVLPCVYRYNGGGAHYTSVGVTENNGKFWVTQCNAGGANMGDVEIRWEFREGFKYLANFRPPTAPYGEPAIYFGPYSRKEIENLIPKILTLSDQRFQSKEIAERNFQALFDPQRQQKSSTPLLRLQVTGNCVTRNVLEWIRFVAGKANFCQEVDDFFKFGQERDWRSPHL